jgi:phosphonate transport system substrate-binding protein
MTACKPSSPVLTIGLIPVQDREELKKSFEPMRRYLEQAMGVPVKVMVPDTYEGLIDAMKNQEVDIGWYGAFSYIAAQQKVELEPMVLEYRKEIGLSYRSLIITKKESSIKTIEDLKGGTFAFVDQGSTSGFVVPYALFKSRDINYEHYFDNVMYLGSHDDVPLHVLSGKVDGGAVGEIAFKRMTGEETINDNDFNILWKSEKIPGSPFAARADLDGDLKSDFQEAMLSIHETSPDAVSFFDDNIERYVKVDDHLYNTTRNMATILGEDFIESYFLMGN